MDIKLGFISDTHTLHRDWFENIKYGQWGYECEQNWNDLDILIFAGDCSSRGYFAELKDFTKWFSEQPATIKIMIAGNHDFGFEDIANFNPDVPRNGRMTTPTIEEIIPKNVIYLNDSGTESFGLNIWGSPITPWFHNWAFNRFRNQGQDDVANGIKKHWDLIPDDTDILITHGPPRGFLDRIHPKFERYNEDPNVGCDDLLEAIQRIKPKVNVFGHIHEGYGKVEKDGTTYINASCLNENYRPVNPPQFLTISL